MTASDLRKGWAAEHRTTAAERAGRAARARGNPFRVRAENHEGTWKRTRLRSLLVLRQVERQGLGRVDVLVAVDADERVGPFVQRAADRERAEEMETTARQRRFRRGGPGWRSDVGRGTCRPRHGRG